MYLSLWKLKEIIQVIPFMHWSESTKDISRGINEIYRVSYMNAHVLLILLNELGKRDKMRDLPEAMKCCSKKYSKDRPV